MKTLFIASGPIEWASSRFRCYWPAEHMDADVVTINNITENPYDYDAVIFQKHGMTTLQRELIDAGKVVLWDACDPMWWFSPDEVRDIARHITAVIVPTNALAEDWRKWHGDKVPVHVVQDRMKPEHYPLKRQHADVSPVRFIWFGVSVNRVALAAGWANLARLAANGHKIELTVFDNAPGVPLQMGDEFPQYSVPWSLEHENEVIANHDIAILPPYPGPWGAMKSNNKALTAWACGLPVAYGQHYERLEHIVENAEARAQAGWAGGMLKETPATSAHELTEVINEYI